jgi:hypothetical protein
MIRFSRYRFTFTALDPIRLPAYAGSALRGLLGHGLKRTLCVTGLSQCSACALRRQCGYTLLFESQTASGQKTLSLQPLVMALDRYRPDYAVGEAFGLELILIGKANRHFPYLIPSWARAGQLGLGPRHSRFHLSSVRQWQFRQQRWRDIYPEPEPGQAPFTEPEPWQPSMAYADGAIRLQLITPYRSKRDGRLITPEQFDPLGFAIALITRIERLRAQHDPDSPPLPVADWIAEAKRLDMHQAKLRWSEVQRRSSRQNTDMNLGGVTGSFQLQGPGLQALMPALELGQWLHVGKNSLFGLGQYRILDPAQPDA